MVDSAKLPLELVLQLCAQAAPEPWYPSAYAKETGSNRDGLDPYLDQLRMGGLIHLTDWVQGRGQGYALTPAGEEVVHNPQQMARLLAGKLSVREQEPRGLKTAASSPWERGEAVRNRLLNPVTPVVTYCLFLINIVFFLGGLFLASREGVPGNDYLYGGEKQPIILQRIGAVNGIGILNKEWWRLITSFFVHAGLLHLGCNMYALYVLGRNGEQFWGHKAFLIIYLVAGFSGSCAALIASPAGGVGASGAICGIFAGEAAWVYLNRSYLPPTLFSAWQRNFTINLVLIVFISFLPGISAAAHFGGAVAGFIVALLLYSFQFGAGWRKLFPALGVLAVPLLSLVLLTRTMANDARWLELKKRLEEFYSQKESREFIKELLPKVQRLEEPGLVTFQEDVKPLLNQHPSRRSAEKVRRAVKDLSGAVSELSAASLLLEKAGPLRDEVVEEARQVRVEQLKARIKLFELCCRSLEQGEKWSTDDQSELEQQRKLMKELDEKWSQF
jgi:membrane associated rhomboid family serine protease